MGKGEGGPGLQVWRINHLSLTLTPINHCRRFPLQLSTPVHQSSVDMWTSSVAPPWTQTPSVSGCSESPAPAAASFTSHDRAGSVAGQWAARCVPTNHGVRRPKRSGACDNQTTDGRRAGYEWECGTVYEIVVHSQIKREQRVRHCSDAG